MFYEQDLTLKEYADFAKSTAVYPGKREFMGLAYVTLGLCGEAGEVAEKVKKTWRDGGDVGDPVFREELAKEIGDVLWYIAQVADEIGYPLALVADMNVEKLRSRQERNALAGSGDNR